VDQVVLVDAGDLTGPQAATREPRAMFLIEIMKQMGYDGLTLGGADARLGRDLLHSLATDPSVPLVSANLREADTGNRFLAPSRVVRKGKLRVGITAVTTLGAGALEDIGLEVGDPRRELEDVLPELRRESDVIVLLANVGLPEAKALSESFDGMIDIVVMGLGTPGVGRTLREEGGSVYVRATGRGQGIGVSRVGLKDGRVDLLSADEELLFHDVPEDPDMAALVETFLTNLNEILRENTPPRPAEREARDGHYYLGAKTCAECHAREFEIWLETPHSIAFDTLVMDQAESLPECYVCHVTGAGDPVGYHPTQEQAQSLQGVQCEVCHGKGTRHARDGSYGHSLRMDSCASCHDEANSPAFDPDVYWRMIEH
jgi:hypothetical protein